MTTPSSHSVTWADLPVWPWPENVEPTTDALADYLTGLSREHFVWLLGQQRQTWAQESRCFIEAHDARLAEYAHHAARAPEEAYRRGYGQGRDDEAAGEPLPRWAAAVRPQDVAQPCPTVTPEPHQLGEFPMTCYRCHVEADS